MRASQVVLIFSVSLSAISVPAIAQNIAGPAPIVRFTESERDDEGANPAPGVEGWTNFSTSGGNPSTAALFLFFAQAPDPFSFTYSLLEPAAVGAVGAVSDQITFSGGNGDGVQRQTLTIRFVSDPANFVTNVYGSAPETGASQLIPLPNLPANGNTLSVFARSDLEVPEPATWTMMMVGFGLAGAALRRRHRTNRGLQPV